ncbi:MAG: glycoside hydrolase family 25 [Lachnospiraceae bacterium]|nr:glycoside hydrolase family 25 [Lachnospiraceae bacterium]
MRLDDDFELDEYDGFDSKKDMRAMVIIGAVFLAALIIGILLFFVFKNRNSGMETGQTAAPGNIVLSDETEASGDNQDAAENVLYSEAWEMSDVDADEEIQAELIAREFGSEVDEASVTLAIAENETMGTTIGIDVAKYQGTIDFKQVADSGIEFVMVRIGYRTARTGIITEDVNAAYNLQQAQANGIKLGAYFFSTAITEEEAKEEADFVADFVAKYPITYPIAYNCEGFTDSENRNSMLSNDERTKIAVAFLDEIAARGYTPMFYSSKSEMEDNAYWDMDAIENSYKVWVSQYPELPYPQANASSYSGVHAMWQYTNQGSIAGISKMVDINVAYFGYSADSEAKDSEAPEAATADAEALMSFEGVSEAVTAKNSTNLRSEPSTLGDTVVYVLGNGEIVTRTGICEASGWSRVDYNGQTLYAVSSYLTTNLEEVSNDSGQAADEFIDEVMVDGVTIKTKFTEVNEQVTAKEMVNLRSLPSVTNEAVKIVGTLSAGETLTRTGINNELGWSRLDYNGQTVYAITSYLTIVE